MVEKVYLLRHGSIDHGSEKRYIGHTDLPLDELGIEQAYAVRDYFKPLAIDAVFTSPLKRCLQTAEILCAEKSMPYAIVDALCEINMGDWENVSVAHIKEHYPKLYAKRGEDLEHFTPTHGESFHDMAKRVREAFEKIVREASGSIIIVAHAGVNRMILTHLFGIEINDMFSIVQPYGCINALTWDSERLQWEYRKVL